MVGAVRIASCAVLAFVAGLVLLPAPPAHGGAPSAQDLCTAMPEGSTVEAAGRVPIGEGPGCIARIDDVEVSLLLFESRDVALRFLDDSSALPDLSGECVRGFGEDPRSWEREPLDLGDEGFSADGCSFYYVAAHDDGLVVVARGSLDAYPDYDVGSGAPAPRPLVEATRAAAAEALGRGAALVGGRDPGSSGASDATDPDEPTTGEMVAGGVLLAGAGAGAVWAVNRGIKRSRGRGASRSEDTSASSDPDDPSGDDPCGGLQLRYDRMAQEWARFKQERDDLVDLLARAEDREAFVLWTGRGKAVVDVLDSARKAGARGLQAILSGMKGGEGIVEKPEAIRILEEIRRGESQLRHRIFVIDQELDERGPLLRNQERDLMRCREEMGR